ncbi:MAG: alpha/beta fold hydrolase [Desulfitobacterium hafniense]|nr:alpha/beta fold hydrolase [Desulfitobacterium hafniense]
MNKIQKHAEPFFFPGGKTGCLLIHGFTGSPSEIRLLGEHLNQAGYTVSGVLLAGHGTTPEDLAKTTWRDWYCSAEKALNQLRRQCDEVFLVGFSMGGIMSLYMSLFLPVTGVISLSAPVYLVNKKILLLPIVKLFKQYHEKAVGGNEVEIFRERFAYNRIPLSSLSSFIEFMKMVRQNLNQVQVPVLLMHSHGDRVASPRSANFIFNKLECIDKELVWLDKSGHHIALEEERGKVFAKVLEFLERLKK